MKISEIFRSIQGEGKLAGTPSVFVRTSVCNLRCIWCDTPYTSWKPEFTDLSVGIIVGETVRLATEGKEPARHVVITGGEPFLQSRELDLLCQSLRLLDYHVTIETNATVFKPVPANLISMSPKLRNSTPSVVDPGKEGRIAERHEERRIRIDIIRRFLEYFLNPPDSDCQVKFVVDNEDDLNEIAWLARVAQIPKGKILLMPQATEPKELEVRSLWLKELCSRTGYAQSPRLHIELYGNQRGF
jgi:7-carboxy-7-deazaguanine synthase